ncbi:MAG: DUF3486 family protein [Alcanivorax sp.]
MPQVSKIRRLNADDKEWLDRELISRGFSGYSELETICRDRGIDISSSALHRYGSDFSERLDRLKMVTEQARAIVAEAPDDEGAINEALMRLVQEKLMGVVMEIEMAPGDIGKIAKAIADLGRASVSQKRLAAEVRQQVLNEQQERLEEMRGSDGMSEDLEGRIKHILLGKK